MSDNNLVSGGYNKAQVYHSGKKLIPIYDIDEHELETLYNGSRSSLLSQFFFASIGVFIPSLFSAIFLNRTTTEGLVYIITAASSAMAMIILGYIWFSSRKEATTVYKQIKSRAKQREEELEKGFEH